ncbi:TetR/AcrR family transcriptional regulator [Saccharopolyspora gloriosae]|uniref:TetR/AcrR family transcriptional regulator n=1 Tax=Saccharopolyspora gloriosae TaxID=455344 RepID=UPI001FB7C4BF|nr:helix-turn-helix domain-containing protein [Saccharopolyspora gloriosae]
MTDLPEHGSPKAARILTAAGELLRGRGSRGVTIAEVAKKAHVGKGTVYLYWKTKEDLLLGLVSRDFITLSEDITAAVTADPDLARPSRLCPDMLRTAAERPFVEALRNGDDELLGVLTGDPRATELLDALGPDAMMYRVLPIWRRHGLATTEWPLDEQALAMHALTTGFTAKRTRAVSAAAGTDPERVLAAAVTALLGPERGGPEEVRAAAAEGLQQLAEGREIALKFIRSQTPAR